MQDYEKLGAFYLGKVYDQPRQQRLDDLLLYDAKDLTTHAVCVGMTGSGKTGLCLALLEEAAIDGLPAIVIDPKGDLGNLLLAFPKLAPEDFAPWLDPADALRQGLTLEQLARKTADTWRNGLAEWNESPERIARFQKSVDIAIYTPGSNAGLPITVLRSFSAPSVEIINNTDAFRERIAATVSGLLALLGIAADPLRSREHILLSNLLERAWRAGRDLDLPQLIREIQSPPFDKLGVMDLESFFSAHDRFDLAMHLNNLLASPGFSAWMEGEALDIQRLLFTPAGQPRLSILSIAHLSDAERMFFVTILLNEVVAWMRSQPGTSSLRALLYMDEIFGYFPPTANPPSKIPMLTLLKQARAFGLGVVLATQNPVDLDYKGLSNAGTWFIGRLQTERDKARVLDGLEGASAVSGAKFDRALLETTLSGLGNRVFLMNNVHDDQPIVFQTRWALSYLRGPLTREQIQNLMAPRKALLAPTAGDGTTRAERRAASAAAGTETATAESNVGHRPVLPPDVPELFLAPAARASATAGSLVYRPTLLGSARVHFVQARSDIDLWESLTVLQPIDGELSHTAWDEAEIREDEPEFDRQPAPSAGFAPLPAELIRPKTYSALASSLKEYLYRTHLLRIWKCAELKEQSRPGESEGDFRVRLMQMMRDRRDLDVEKLREKYASKLAGLQEKIRKAEQRVEKEKAQATEKTFQSMLSFGSSILGALFGRKLASSTNVGRAATAMRSAGRVARERGEVSQAQENVEVLQQQLSDLEAQFEADVEGLKTVVHSDEFVLEEIALKPKKSEILVSRVALAWQPSQQDV